MGYSIYTGTLFSRHLLTCDMSFTKLWLGKYNHKRIGPIELSFLIAVLFPIFLLLLLHGSHSCTDSLRVGIHSRQVLQNRLEELGVVHDLGVVLVLVVHVHLLLGP